MVGSMDVNVAPKGVHAVPSVFSGLESAQPENTTGDQIALLDLFVKIPEEFAGGHAGEENGARLRVAADLLIDAVETIGGAL